MEKYFAAANSAGGFVSWFDSIFAPEKFDRVCLIKGGSGTGKSTLMKRIAAHAVEKSFTCEYFYCSSDPDSLDGIIVKSENCRGIAVVDATAPHTRDPKLPGAVEEIVNLGEFWDSDKLRSNRDEIADLVREKSALFAESYEYLFAAGELSKMLRSDAARFIKVSKMNAAADRLVAQRMHKIWQESGKKKSSREVFGVEDISIRGVSAISTKGIAHFDTYRECDFLCAVEDRMNTAAFMFDALIASAKRAGLKIVRAPMPLEPDLTEAIRLPELGMSVVMSEGIESDDVKLLNMERFIDRGAISSDDKQRRRLLTKCESELIDCALARLGEARRLHSQVESIYIAAMDFDKLNEFTENLLMELID